VRSAAKKVIAMNRVSRQAAPRLPETIFDSPLQQALHILSRLADGLAEAGDEESAAKAMHIAQLLHSKHLHASGIIDEISLGSVTAGDGVHGWLASMELMPQAGPENKSGHHAPAGDEAKHMAALNPRLSLSSDESELMRLLEHGIPEWSFDALALHRLSNGHALSTLGWALFERENLRQKFSISAETLCSFLAQLESAYKHVPYHNAAHGACVAHGAYWFATNAAIKGAAASPIDMLSLIFAALMHDVSHDGHNNAFHVATGSDLALLYSDQSVLEMHHLATGFRLLRSAQSDISAKMSAEHRKHLRSTVISMVLATDLTQNFNVISAYKTMLEPVMPEGDYGPHGPPRTRKEDRVERGDVALFSSRAATMEPGERLTVLKMAIKCADIGNVTKGKPTALLWTDRVVQEFFAQGDDERSLGLPVTPMLDRASANVAKQQLGFYNFIVRPMYVAMDLLVDMTQHMANLEEMHAHWSEQVSEEERTDAGGALVIRSSEERMLKSQSLRESALSVGTTLSFSSPSECTPHNSERTREFSPLCGFSPQVSCTRWKGA